MGGAEVVRPYVASDPAADLDRIEAVLVGRLEGDDLAVPDGGGKVGSERRNAAALRGISGNESGLGDGVGSSRGAGPFAAATMPRVR